MSDGIREMADKKPLTPSQGEDMSEETGKGSPLLDQLKDALKRAEQAEAELAKQMKVSEQWRVLYEGMNTPFANKMAERAAEQQLRAVNVERELSEARRMARKVVEVLRAVRNEISKGYRAATEENFLDGPWMPAGLSVKINETLAEADRIESGKESVK